MRTTRHIALWNGFLAVFPALFVVAFASLAPACAHAGTTVTLAWDANTETDLAGYRIHYGDTPGSYSQTLDVGNITTATVSDLSPGGTYYFAVTAYNTAALESDPSNEVSFTVPSDAPPPPSGEEPPVHVPNNPPDPPANQVPTVRLTTPSSGAHYIAPATVSLSASATDGDGAVARVEFFEGAKKIGESTSSPFTIEWREVPAGNYTITARATDDRGASADSAGVSVTVARNRPPTVRLVSPANESSHHGPAGISLLAEASDTDGAVARVEFFDGTSKLGEATQSPYRLDWANVAPGAYQLTAVAYDDAGESTVSESVLFHVKRLAIGGTRRLTNGHFEFTVTGAPGRTTTVEVSSDLITWAPAFDFVNTTGSEIVTVHETAATGRRFYRVSDGAVISEPAGFTTLTATGPAQSNAGSVFSFLGISLLCPVEYEGSVTSAGVGSITEEGAGWDEQAFETTGGEGFFLEVTSGPTAGLFTDIVSIDRETGTITLDENFSPYLSGGESYRIRKHRTIAEVFGPNNEAGLTGAASVSKADDIRILNAVTQSFATYYFKTGGFGGRGWRSTTDAAADAGNTRLYFDQGIIICRKTPGAVRLELTGSVKTGPTAIPIGPGTNLIANVYAAGTLTLENSGLYTGDPATGLADGPSISTADEVRMFDGTTIEKFYYKRNGTGGTGWRSSGNAIRDAGKTPIPSGTAIYVVRKSGRPAWVWTVPPPFGPVSP